MQTHMHTYECGWHRRPRQQGKVFKMFHAEANGGFILTQNIRQQSKFALLNTNVYLAFVQGRLESLNPFAMLSVHQTIDASVEVYNP